MVTRNVYQHGGIINGTSGRIWEIVYERGKAPPALPIALLLEIPTYHGESFVKETPHIFALRPSLVSYEMGDSAIPCTIRQFGIMLAYALTIHKSEGSTLQRAYVDLGKREPPTAPGMTFVALSRCHGILTWPVDSLGCRSPTTVVHSTLRVPKPPCSGGHDRCWP